MQLALLLGDKTSSAAATALDTLERAIGKPLFQRLFGLILTDNGTEFSNTATIERSAWRIRPDVKSTTVMCANPSRRAVASAIMWNYARYFPKVVG
jgi:hypothetical protein